MNGHKFDANLKLSKMVTRYLCKPLQDVMIQEIYSHWTKINAIDATVDRTSPYHNTFEVAILLYAKIYQKLKLENLPEMFYRQRSEASL